MVIPNDWATRLRGLLVCICVISIDTAVMAAPIISATPTIWLDADDNSTITTIGASVSSWSNKGSIGGSFTMPTPANQPTYVPAAVGGLRDVVRFVANDYLNTTLQANQAITASAYTMFTVFQGNVANGGSSTAPYTNGTIIGDQGYGGWGTFVRGGATPQSQNYQWDTNADIVALNMTNAGYYLNTAYLSAGTLSGRTIGESTPAQTGSTPAGNINSAVFASTTTMRLGGNYLASPNAFLTGDIAEILIYNTVLSPTDRGLVENYLFYKWLPEPGGLAAVVFATAALLARRRGLRRTVA